MESDEDAVIIGDFNTMGEDVPNAGSEAESKREIEEMVEMLVGQDPAWRHVVVEPSCTEYYRGRSGWLDHVVVTSAIEEASGVKARVSGYCAVANCARLDEDEMPQAYRDLSDHCPLVMDIGGEDVDGGSTGRE